MWCLRLCNSSWLSSIAAGTAEQECLELARTPVGGDSEYGISSAGRSTLHRAFVPQTFYWRKSPTSFFQFTESMPRSQHQWAPSWDAMDLLNLEPTSDRGLFNCVGTTKKGHRCGCQISKQNVQDGRDILRRLPSRSLDAQTLEEDLEAIVYKLLCVRSHRSRQVDQMVEKWRSVVLAENEKSRVRFERRQARMSRRREDIWEEDDDGEEVTPARTSSESEPRRRAGLHESTETSASPTGALDHDHEQIQSASPPLPTTSPTNSPETVATPPPTIQPRSSQMTRRMEQLRENSCPICIDAFVDPCETPCGHIFCSSCVAQWLVDNEHCPNCRQSTVQDDLVVIRGGEEIMARS